MENSINILFSILIPAYKSTYLRAAIESCIWQKYPLWELIIVDDASPEDLRGIVNDFNDERISYYRNTRNYGAINVVDNWNKCLSFSKGDYIICMGDDDVLLPCCLNEYVSLISKYPNLGLYHAWTEIIDEEGNFLDIQHPRPEYEGVMSLCWNRWNGRNRQYIGDFCFEAEILKRDGGFYKLPLAWASDDITAVRAASVKGVANTQVICFQYRENRQTLSNTGNTKVKIDAILQEREWFSTFFSDVSNYHLSEIETKFLLLLKRDYQMHFKKKIHYLVMCDICTKKKHFLYWFRNRQKLEVSLYKLILWKIRSAFNLFVQTS